MLTQVADLTPTAEKEEVSAWANQIKEENKKAVVNGQNFINAVKEMSVWSLDQTVSYLTEWSDKARLTHLLNYDHLHQATLITVSKTRFDTKAKFRSRLTES
jgi:hypothetical protein